eukprot:14915306-Ditylum_brightwellii.AAC.1
MVERLSIIQETQAALKYVLFRIKDLLTDLGEMRKAMVGETTKEIALRATIHAENMDALWKIASCR